MECFWRDQKLVAHTGSEHTCTNNRGILPFSICSLSPSPGREGRESGLGRVEEKVFPSPPSLWETGLWVAIPTFFSRSLPLTKHSTYSQRHMEEDLGCGGGDAVTSGRHCFRCLRGREGRGGGKSFRKSPICKCAFACSENWVGQVSQGRMSQLIACDKPKNLWRGGIYFPKESNFIKSN